MFLNCPQHQDLVEVFDAKTPKDKDRISYKAMHTNGVSRVFDPLIKNYVIDMKGGTTNKLIVPRDEKEGLFLTQQYLILQVQPTQNFSLQLFISDSNKIKRRIIISHNCVKPESKLFFVKIPSGTLDAQWHYLSIDLWSFISQFPGQTYRALEYIYLGGNFKLRKIFTSKYPIYQSRDEAVVTLPKQFMMPSQLSYTHKAYRCSDFFPEMGTVKSGVEATLIANQSQVDKRDRRSEYSTPKTPAAFRISRSKGRQFENNSEMYPPTKCGVGESNRFAKSTTKSVSSNPPPIPIQTKKFLHRPPLLKKTTASSNIASTNNGTSVQASSQNYSMVKKEGVGKDQETININKWRIHKNSTTKTSSTASKSKEISRTAKTTQSNNPNLKIPLMTHKQFMPEKSLYSDSEYLEMSQKFSTITDQRFFKHQLQNKTYSKNGPQKLSESMNEEIEEAIENETNSVAEEVAQQPKNHVIHEQIKVLQEREDTLGESQGFASKHCQKLLSEIQRPYTPPFRVDSEISEASHPKVDKAQKNENEVQLIYDPVLNCYYDFKTHTYYELRA